MISKDEADQIVGEGVSLLMSDINNPTASESLSPVSLISASNHLGSSSNSHNTSVVFF